MGRSKYDTSDRFDVRCERGSRYWREPGCRADERTGGTKCPPCDSESSDAGNQRACGPTDFANFHQRTGECGPSANELTAARVSPLRCRKCAAKLFAVHAVGKSDVGRNARSAQCATSRFAIEQKTSGKQRIHA